MFEDPVDYDDPQYPLGSAHEGCCEEISNFIITDEKDEGNKELFFVTVRDTIEQVTTYIVRAESNEEAETLIEAGIYMEQSAPETIDTIDSTVMSVGKISSKGKGQER